MFRLLNIGFLGLTVNAVELGKVQKDLFEEAIHEIDSEQDLFQFEDSLRAGLQ